MAEQAGRADQQPRPAEAARAGRGASPAQPAFAALLIAVALLSWRCF